MKKHSFKNPPINEVACSIQYESQNSDLAPQFEFYEKIKHLYPIVTENPPLPYVYDRLSNISSPASPKKIPFARYFFIDSQNSKLIQLQEGRFLFNWRKIDGVSVYPKFEAVFEEFQQNWKVFLDLLDLHKTKVTINQLELTYVDHIQFSDFNKEQWSLSDIFCFLQKEPLSGSTDNVSFKFSVPVDLLSGHLHLTGQSAIRNTDKKALLVFDTTARGIINQKLPTIKEWFEKAHDTIYESFINLITDKAKNAWGYLE
jgi:uncharacterized protein (TIGR04255 family)